MARPLRIEYSGALYHLISRGDRREAIFEDDEESVDISARPGGGCRALPLAVPRLLLDEQPFPGHLFQGRFKRVIRGWVLQYENCPRCSLSVPLVVNIGTGAN